MDHKEATETMDEEARRLGLHIEAIFVPLYRSRNANEKHPTVNWRVRLLRHGANRVIWEGDYSQGTGHLKTPPRFDPRSVDGAMAIRAACETGKGRRHPASLVASVQAVPPTVVDILSSLLLDASAIDEGSFEDWAASFGYDPDSRKAEKIWKACVETGLKLRSELGDEILRRFQELAFNL